MADIEILDDADAYPYSSHISINGHKLELGDLLLVFDDTESSKIYSAEQIYGFTWGSVITHVVDSVVPAESHDVNSLGDKLGNGKVAIAHKWEQNCYRSDEDTVRRISLYRNFHQNGWQPIVVDETRDLLHTDFTSQNLLLCKDVSEMIDKLYHTPPESNLEAEGLRNTLLNAGVQESALPSTDNHSLNAFDE